MVSKIRIVHKSYFLQLCWQQIHCMLCAPVDKNYTVMTVDTMTFEVKQKGQRAACGLKVKIFELKKMWASS